MFHNLQLWYLSRRLRSQKHYRRLDAYKALLAFGGKSETIFLQALGDRSAAVRTLAAKALGELGSTVATERLIQCLGDPDDSVALMAAEALGHIGAQEALAPLKGMYGNASKNFGSRAAESSLVNAAIISAAKLGDEVALAWFEDYLVYERSARFPGIGYLALDDGRKADILRALVRKPSSRSLITLGVVCHRLYWDRVDELTSPASKCLTEYVSEKAGPFLTAKLSDPRPLTQIGAATALGLRRQVTAVEPLALLLQAGNKPCLAVDDSILKELSAGGPRLAAAVALARLGDRRGIEIVLNVDLFELRRFAATNRDINELYDIADEPYHALILRLCQYGDARAIHAVLSTMIAATYVITAKVSKTGKEQRQVVHDARVLPLFRKVLSADPGSIDTEDLRRLICLRAAHRTKTWEGHGDFSFQSFKCTDVDCHDIQQLARAEMERRSAKFSTSVNTP